MPRSTPWGPRRRWRPAGRRWAFPSTTPATDRRGRARSGASRRARRRRRPCAVRRRASPPRKPTRRLRARRRFPAPCRSARRPFRRCPHCLATPPCRWARPPASRRHPRRIRSPMTMPRRRPSPLARSRSPPRRRRRPPRRRRKTPPWKRLPPRCHPFPNRLPKSPPRPEPSPLARSRRPLRRRRRKTPSMETPPAALPPLPEPVAEEPPPARTRRRAAAGRGDAAAGFSFFLQRDRHRLCEPATASLPGAAREILDGVAERLAADPAIRVVLKAYASAEGATGERRAALVSHARAGGAQLSDGRRHRRHPH